MDIFEKVKLIIMDHTDYDGEIKESTKIIEELGLDSMDISQIIASVEDEFRIEISQQYLMHLRTVGDIVKCINGLMSK